MDQTEETMALGGDPLERWLCETEYGQRPVSVQQVKQARQMLKRLERDIEALEGRRPDYSSVQSWQLERCAASLPGSDVERAARLALSVARTGGGGGDADAGVPAGGGRCGGQGGRCAAPG